MKNIFSFVLLYVIIFQLNAQNLIINPGFESWQKINKPDGWSTAIACTKDSVFIYTGFYSCKQLTITISKDIGQLIPVTPGKLYTLSFRYMNDPAETGNGCRLWSNWNDIDGKLISDAVSLPFLHSGFLKSESWAHYSAEVTAPAAAHSFNLILRTLPNSITFWDEVIFQEGIPANSQETYFTHISIYPNPAYNHLTINNLQNIQYIDIHTITGIKVWSKRVICEESLLIPLTGFKDGIYVISFKNHENLYTKKFIKASD